MGNSALERVVSAPLWRLVFPIPALIGTPAPHVAVPLVIVLGVPAEMPLTVPQP